MIVRPLLELLLALFVIMEVLWPLIQGRPLFPLFRRRRESQLLQELEHARKDLDEDDIEDQVIKLRAAHAERHPELHSNKEETNEPNRDIDDRKVS